MNPVQDRIREHLDSLPADLAPLVKSARRHQRRCSAVATDGTLLIAHQPWVAPEAYALRLHPGAKKPWFAKYAKLHDIRIPTGLRPLLTAVNGCSAFGMSIYGMPPSMLNDPPLLDRSSIQCMDIATANTDWKHEFEGVESGAFHFGGRDYSDDEVTGYFLTGKSTVSSVLPDGKVVGTWNDIPSFLTDELAASEKLECADIPKDWWH